VKFGRLGVGRFAVHRIGNLSRWTTVARVGKTLVRSQFSLDASHPKAITVEQDTPPEGTLTGTCIEIVNLCDSNLEPLTSSRLAGDLMAQFCGFLLGNPSRRIVVQGQAMSVADIIESTERETIPAAGMIPEDATLTHHLLNRPVERSRFPAQLLFTAKGRTVAAAQPDDPPSPCYLGMVECAYLESKVTSNREALLEMDGGFNDLRQGALDRVKAFGERFRKGRKRQFIERARQENFYPYRTAPTDAMASVHQAVYDVVLEKVNEHANLEGMSKKQQAVVFKLLQRSLENENVVEVLEQVADLSDDDMAKFRRVLEHTTLDSIIKLSSEVTTRLTFLDVLHALTYGSIAKHLKERTQLHWIIEPHCWLFGPRFHLATSDQSFREVVRKHRKIAGLDEAPEAVVDQIKGIEDIPDLFLAASRDYPIDPKHHHVLVEIKRPSVVLGTKEKDQIHRYASTILRSSEFDQHNTRWDLLLVSSKVSDDIELDRTQANQPNGRLWSFKNMDVWAFEWSEIISRARDEMQLVRDHLRQKSKELSVSDYLRDNFPEILEALNAQAQPPTTATATRSGLN
jgi:hypothetical protein